jgi:hypothetical protein
MMRRLLQDRTAATAAEFAIVLPLLLIFLLGIVDAGRWLWTYNRGQKAAQMGARFAVVTDPISPGLDTDYVGVSGLTQGDAIPAADFGTITCTATGTAASPTATCTCTTSPCPSLGTADSTAYKNVLDRVRDFMPEVTPSNMNVIYSSSGLGYAGNPNGPDLSPLVTIQLAGLRFTPITSFLILSMPMPTFRMSLTAEDENGSQSN